MRWYKELYVSDTIGRKANRIKWKIKHNAGTIGVYVISLSANPDNLLDIIPAHYLLQKAYPKKDMYIIGLAQGYDDALELTTRIIQDIYDKTGAVEWKSYFDKEKGER